MKISGFLCSLILALAPFGVLAGRGLASAKSRYLVYVGTYTTGGEAGAQAGKSKGIYAYGYDPATGILTPMGVAAEAANPSFLAVDPTRARLYAVNELGDYGGPNSGGISAFSLDWATGQLSLLNELATRGADPCHLSIDKTGKYILVANYTGGSVAAFPLLADGSLGNSSAFLQSKGSGVDPARQEGPHAHMIRTSPDNRFVLVADLGLDELQVYRFDSLHGSLTPNKPAFAKVKAGSGPRHFAFHPNGRWVYLASEMKSTVTVFSYDSAGGVLHEFQTISSLPPAFAGTSDAAEIEVHPSGKFLYSSNRGHDSIAVFSIDGQKGTLTPVEYAPTRGKTPRNFAIDPTGKYLFAANQESNNIVSFRIDQESGRLTPAGQVVEVPSPVSIVFAASE